MKNKGGMTKEQMADQIASTLCGGEAGVFQGLPRATVSFMYLNLRKDELAKVYCRVVLGIEADELS